jgi:hypothetical protein
VLNKAVGQGGLAVIDVGDDAKVAGLVHGPPVLERAARAGAVTPYRLPAAWDKRN